MTHEYYLYRVSHCEVLDGDTVRLDIELGLGCSYRDTFRIAGIDTPEKRGAEAVKAAAATGRLKELCLLPEISVRTIKTKSGDAREKYGRYLAELFSSELTESFGETLIKEGHAIPYFGGKKQ